MESFKNNLHYAEEKNSNLEDRTFKIVQSVEKHNNQ